MLVVFLILKENKQLLTMYKNNSRNSGESKSCYPLQISCILTGMEAEIGYYSYTHC